MFAYRHQWHHKCAVLSFIFYVHLIDFGIQSAPYAASGTLFTIQTFTFFMARSLQIFTVYFSFTYSNSCFFLLKIIKIRLANSVIERATLWTFSNIFNWQNNLKINVLALRYKTNSYFPLFRTQPIWLAVNSIFHFSSVVHRVIWCQFKFRFVFHYMKSTMFICSMLKTFIEQRNWKSIENIFATFKKYFRGIINQKRIKRNKYEMWMEWNGSDKQIAELRPEADENLKRSKFNVQFSIWYFHLQYNHFINVLTIFGFGYRLGS